MSAAAATWAKKLGHDIRQARVRSLPLTDDAREYMRACCYCCQHVHEKDLAKHVRGADCVLTHARLIQQRERLWRGALTMPAELRDDFAGLRRELPSGSARRGNLYEAFYFPDWCGALEESLFYYAAPFSRDEAFQRRLWGRALGDSEFREGVTALVKLGASQEDRRQLVSDFCESTLWPGTDFLNRRFYGHDCVDLGARRRTA